MKIEDSVSILPFIGPSYQKKLENLGIKTIKDLLYHIPHRYIDFSKNIPIAKTKIGEMVTIKGEVVFLKNQYTRRGLKIQICQVKDVSGRITVIWFNQPFLTRTIFPKDKLSLAGKVDWFGRGKALISPEYEKIDTNLHTGRLIPVYPETEGVSSKWLRGRIKTAIEYGLSQLEDFLPEIIIKQNSLLGLDKAIMAVHYPKDLLEAEKGRQRLAFDELLSLEMASLARKKTWQKNKTVHKLAINKKKIEEFINTLPFKLTPSQRFVYKEIIADLKKDIPMNRLLEGDVGSGKTVVAAIAAFVIFLNKRQTIIMAPTQILAEQHYQTFKKLFKNYKIALSLVTSTKQIGCVASADIIIGTHSLLYGKISLENAALVIIDEQHKFGVAQRTNLIKKGRKGFFAPHLLNLTATPIPRTVALTLYGDQELSVLTEMPKGRITTTTWIVPQEKRGGAYTWIKEKIDKEGVQVYVVCPFIEESSTENLSEVKAVKSEFEKLRREFKNYRVDILHGKIKDKTKVIEKFRKGKTNILVTTPVIEVGMDIANANIMIIEAGDRFGLAQLHQLRGRIGRGDKKSYCLIFSDSPSSKTALRLEALKNERSGFKLAEIDLSLRGPGEIFGFKQSGIPELKIARWNDLELIKKAKQIAGKNFLLLQANMHLE